MAEDHVSSQMETVARFIGESARTPLPAEVERKTGYHVLDTIAAMVTGARMSAGQLAANYVRSQGGVGEALVIGTDHLTNATWAAYANAMSAHADETDDSHAPSLSHPGCAVVPAALAIAERHGQSGTEFLRAVSAGYDIGCRITPMLNMSNFSGTGSNRSSHAMVSVWGAAAAAAALEGLTDEQIRWALSYTAHQSSGVTTWLRDTHHVEKAFLFAGMGARNGVASATFVSSGMDGVGDVFTGRPNYLDAISDDHDLDILVRGLGSDYMIMETNIKKYAVGSPAQAAVQAMENLIAREGLTHDQVERLEIHLPADLAEVVDSRHMPDINCQYLVAGTLVDGRFSFEMAHDEERMLKDEIIKSLVARTDYFKDEATSGTRKGRVIAHLTGGTSVEDFVEAVDGTAQKPMTEDMVLAKMRDLLVPVIGTGPTEQLIELILDPAQLKNVRDLRPILSI